MKSWLHNIAESYIYETPGTRRDLKEHYNLLTEEEKFALLSENALKYLDEQLKTAYGFGVADLTEEQLDEFVGQVLRNIFKPRERSGSMAQAIVTQVRDNKLGDATVTHPRERLVGGSTRLRSQGEARSPRTAFPPPAAQNEWETMDKEERERRLTQIHDPRRQATGMVRVQPTGRDGKLLPPAYTTRR